MHLNDLGNEWTGKVYVYWDTRYGRLLLDYSDILEASADYILLGTSEEITVPLIAREDAVNKQVEALRAERQRVLAESQRRADEIEQQIQSLLAIEHKPEV